MIAIFSFISITAPFWHIFSQKGVGDSFLGFKTIRSFLYTFGMHFALFGCSIFSFWAINIKSKTEKQIDNISKIKRNILNIIACTYCSVSIYYLLYTFIDTNSPYPDYYYEIAFIVGAIVVSVIILFFFNLQIKIRDRKDKFEKESEYFLGTALNFIDEINHSIIK
ncbi:hypothetical protein A8C32_16765 [Flavivirga aquatica]|uniref:Uncharacterized protein n=1 Tax=Flavivirga aquatica TaxID=1849968 RepID=A0A1E5T8I9_9FLAO|nr:hypothetical protein A8C32_16765 [Flavivirga aquatica]